LGAGEFQMARPGLPAFLALLWFQVALHECGHALAAVLVGFRLKVLAVGPLVFTKDSGRFRIGFTSRGLLLSGGYMGAVPDSAHRFRLRQIIVIAAGPFSSLASGAVFLGISFLLPGTAAQNLWPLAAMAAVLGFYIGVVNLLPLGYCDGTMLLHLVLRTRRGEELTNLSLQRAHLKPAGEPGREYEDDVQERRAALVRMLESPAPDPAELGAQYISLASVELAAQRRRDAGEHVRKGLALLAEVPLPASEALGWWCLQILLNERHDAAGAAEAYARGLAAARRVGDSTEPEKRLHAGFTAASLHLQAQAWEQALAEAGTALERCPRDEAWRMSQAMLLHYRAQALFATGRADAGLEAVGQAAAIGRAQTVGVSGPHLVGLLGGSLWNAGRTREAIPLVTEAIRLLESRGARRLGAAFRLLLAEMLRGDGQAARAACVLPQPEPQDSDLHWIYRERRGAIRRSGGKLREAVADLEALVAIVEREAPGDDILLATARARLAAGLAEAGDRERSLALARQVYQALESCGHPEFAGACITLAIAGRDSGSPAHGYVEAALRCWEAAPCLLPAAKARELEDAARSLEAAGLAQPASRCRAAAARWWAKLEASPARVAVGD